MSERDRFVWNLLSVSLVGVTPVELVAIIVDYFQDDLRFRVSDLIFCNLLRVRLLRPSGPTFSLLWHSYEFCRLSYHPSDSSSSEVNLLVSLTDLTNAFDNFLNIDSVRHFLFPSTLAPNNNTRRNPLHFPRRISPIMECFLLLTALVINCPSLCRLLERMGLGRELEALRERNNPSRSSCGSFYTGSSGEIVYKLPNGCASPDTLSLSSSYCPASCNHSFNQHPVHTKNSLLANTSDALYLVYGLLLSVVHEQVEALTLYSTHTNLHTPL
jgi:hypothetical protein